MAGAGKKTFTAGEVLTASDVNTYLMEQSVMVFGGTAARSSAIPTPSEGMTSYRTDTQQIESYDGANWIGMSGLQLIKKQTVGSGVASVAVTNAFNATYENYRIMYTGGVGSGNTPISLTLNNASAGTYALVLMYASAGVNTPLVASATGVDIFTWAGNMSTTQTACTIELTNPFLAKTTTFSANYHDLALASAAGRSTGVQVQAVSHTGFTLLPTAGTMTGGTIYVYGYGV